MHRMLERWKLVAAVGLSAGALAISGTLPASAFVPADPSLNHAILGANSAAVPGKYVVKLRDNPSVRNYGVAARARSLAGGYKGKLDLVLNEAAHGFAVSLSAQDAERLASDPDVEYVQQQATYHVENEETGAPSSLDRIDQRALPLTSTYNYSGLAGVGVHAYIIDSGVRITHSEIFGRATWGYNAITGTTNADDCNGHGSHVAGTLGGTTYGVAKKVSIVSVKAFDCSGQAQDPAIINSIDWVTAHAIKPAVINLSLGRICTDGAGVPTTCPVGASQAIVDAEERALGAGITVVTSAGNENAEACFNPVGAAAGTINVGATNLNDSKRPSSNFGSCVRIWAPGESIVSIGGVGIDPGTGTRQPDPLILSGTSHAAPHVAGAVAILLSTPQFAKATPAEISAELDAQATVGVITGLDASSPNKLLYSRPEGGRLGSPIALASNANGKLMLLGADEDWSMSNRTQTEINSTSWDNETRSATFGWASVGAERNKNGTIGLVGLSVNDQIWQRQQANVDARRWLQWSHLDEPGPANQAMIPGATSVAVALDHHDKLIIFVANRSGQVYYRTQITPGGKAWGLWQKLDFTGNAASLAAELDSKDRVNLFIADTKGKVWMTRQKLDSNLNPLDTLESISELPNSFAPNLMADITVASRLAVPAQLVLIGTDASGNVFQSGLDGDLWNPWTPLPKKTLLYVAAQRNAGSAITVVGVDSLGSVWQSTQLDPTSNSYSPWVKIDGVKLRS